MSAPPAPLYVRLLSIAMSCVVSGVGVLAMLSGHAPERWTRMGFTAALEDGPARVFGMAVFCFGLLPLMLLARTPRGALWIGSLAATLGMLALFIGLSLLR